MNNTLLDQEVRQRFLSRVARRTRKCAKGEDLILTVHSRLFIFQWGHSGQRLGSIAEWGSLANGVNGLILLEKIMVSPWVQVRDF